MKKKIAAKKSGFAQLWENKDDIIGLIWLGLVLWALFVLQILMN